jgi:integrase
MCTYLSSTRSTYYFRRGIPAELRPFLQGRHEWMRSLGTKDRATAKQRIPAVTIETDALLASARARLDAGERPVPMRGDNHAYAPSDRDVATMAHEAAETERRDGRLEQLGPFIAFAEKRLKGSTEQMPRALRAFKHILDAERHDKETLRLHLQAARAELAEMRRTQSPEGARERVPASAVVSVPILATFDAYAKAQAMTAGVAKELRASMAGLVRFIGHDDAARLTEGDVRRWRDMLAKEVTQRGKVRNPATVKKRVGAVSSMLRWAVEESQLSENVGSKVFVRPHKAVKLRERDFTHEEAGAILTASLVPASAAMAEGHSFARRWIPWLCAYTGARVNELSQLRGQDIANHDGIWAMRITPEAGTTKDKNFRLVPLHPHLIEQGFLDAIKVKGEGPLFFNPASQRVASDDNRHFKKVGERLASWVRTSVGITDPGVKPNHGWRHTFKTRSLLSEMPERVADAIQGHAPTSVGQTYGSVPLSVKAEALAKMPRFDVPGLDLQKPKTR